MAIDLVLESLRRVPPFAGLTREQIAEIGRGAQRRAFRQGEVIVEAGVPGDGAYLILSGEAACRSNPDARGRTEPIEPGSLVGEPAMFVDHDYRTTVVAKGWVDCLKLQRATLREQMRADPDIAERLADAIRSRLSLVAAELQIVERLLMASIERCTEAPLPLMPPTPAGLPAIAAGLVQ